ncbi:glycosyltransferase family 4 protein [Geoalkalibacter sp.]|uniref:glycosyltransferase family 4 protein n=1 Tax=Geoalkalibacter sp. TaxID=3041440 RepID=UPI00272DFC01|nr:glycosyltransferase family 4 protein [Geoalkalibacter sp.]
MAKILLFSDAKAFGGAEKYLVSLAKYINGKGYEVTVVFFSSNELSNIKNEFSSTGCNVVFDFSIKKFINFIFENINEKIILHANASWRNRFLIYILISRIFRINTVITEHTVPELLQPAKKFLGQFAFWRIKFFKRALLRKIEWFLVDRIIAVSPLVSQKLNRQRGLPSKKTKVIFNGIDPEKFTPSPLRDSLDEALNDWHGVVIGSVGRLAPEKAYDRLVQVFSQIKRKDVALLLVGEGDSRAEIEKMAIKLGVKDRVFLVGHKSDVLPYLLKMDIFALTSYYEAMPFCIIEAMSCKIPVVSVDVGGISDIINHGENGYLVNSEEISSFTKYLEELVNNQGLRAELGSNARLTVLRKFSEQVMLAQTLDCYLELIE